MFGLSATSLPIWLGGQRLPVPRMARLCMHCYMGALSDGSHVLFNCPATQAARALYAHFPPGCPMLQFMRHAGSRAVAFAYLHV